MYQCDNSNPRIVACTKVLYKFFRKHPNNIFQTRQIRAAATQYDDCLIYNCTRILYRDRIINCTMIRGAKFYWLRHKEKGD